MAIGDSTVAMAIGESSEEVQAREGKKFPVGLRVVAVDDDQICLAMLNKLLIKCEYQVTCFTDAVEALKMIKENKDEIDLVITDVHMPNIDGFKLLEIAGLQLDLPVIMLSANDTSETVMKGIMHGACDYLIKPVRFEELSVIWKHVARRYNTLEELNEDATNNNQATIGEDNADRRQRGTTDGNNAGNCADNCADNCAGKRRKEDSGSDDMKSKEKSGKKKARLVWSQDLHRTFVDAVSDIGIDKAVPKSILERMSREDLTRENVASHLQKYRQYLKRINSNPNAFQAVFGSGNSFSIDLRSFECFKNYHSRGRYQHPSRNNSSPARSTRLNRTSENSPSSAVPDPPSSSQMTQIGGCTGFNNTSPSDAGPSNVMNNTQMNQHRGVNGMSSFPGTSNSNYYTQFNNHPNYPAIYYPAWGPVPFAPFGYPMTNVPPISNPNSMVGPLFGAGPSQTGGNFNSGTGAGLPESISSFNTSWNVPNPSITGGMNNISSDNFSPFFNNPAINGGMGTGAVNVGIATGNVSGERGTSFLSGGVGASTVSGGMGTSTMSGGMGTSSVSGGMGTSPVNGIGTGNVSGGMETDNVGSDTRSGPESGGMGTTLVSGIGTGIVSGDIETGNMSGGMGTGIVNSVMGTDAVNGGMWTGNVSGDMGTGNVSGGMETGPLNGGMGTRIVSDLETRPVTQGVSEFDGATFGTIDNVADHTSSSFFHVVDDVSISGLDELLSSLRTSDGGDDAYSLPFMDSDFFN